MEADIFKLILANKGAVETTELFYNFYPGDVSTVSELISNREKFAVCPPKVVARTRLKLCRVKDCPGACRGLHLCKNFLFSGLCRFTQLRRHCNFSHELNSDHNQRILSEHELDSLSREELCTLLLQSDHTLLPSICHDYNNGDGVFGRCQEGDACKRLHICERYVRHECSCFRTHDFNAPQLKKNLAGVPDPLFHSLKSVYANKEALRLYDRADRGHRGHRGNRGNRGNFHHPRPFTGGASAACYIDGCSDGGSQPMQWHRGRGRGRGRGVHRGNRGNRGNKGNNGNRGNLDSHSLQRCATSLSNILDNIDDLDLYGEGSLDSDASDASASTANDDDTHSNSGQSRMQARYQTSAVGRGRGQGTHQRPKTTRSTSDLVAAVRDENTTGGDGRKQDERRPVRDKTEICMYFIKGYCKHGERCFKAHDKMPYRWEVQEGDQWTHLPNNETIEKDYCDPQKTYSSSPAICFDTMTCGPNKIRRLTTINSLVEPNFIHTTEWVWYWQDEFGKWNEYASAGVGRSPSDIDSAKLEQKFWQNDKDVVEFTAGSQLYTLSFQDMIQTNKRYGTKKIVSRRPRFVSAADMQEKKVRRPLVPPNSTPVPDYWDKTQIPATGSTQISLQHASAEFKEVEALFCNTMRGFDITSIKRIQNKALWEVFQWQKNHMKTNNGGRDVTEKKLFHGTDNKHIEAICHHNFDWRICGTHGTAYGKGSYFARDAKYSHSYTSTTDVRSMFICRVLVGTYTRGKSEYTRPPSKDGGDINFFDSCVDCVIDPAIFVVFEKHQIYPEYLLQYKEDDPYAATPAPRPAAVAAAASSTQAAAAVAASRRLAAAAASRRMAAAAASTSTSVSIPKPVVSPKPAPAPTPVYLSSTASLQRSTSLYQTSTAYSGYKTSSTINRPTQYSPTPSPSLPAKKPSDPCVIA
ncbi:protein mono-ADP-ribosyltransferase PARP12 isoform X2 [Parambassis ranga]|uniref:Protein mono-ADP-ribosyltransferase PARP12 isoform X2 n=1 Tax=Parambassis ranga TaxID=210632 RepID=A0A6P7HR51_9TELE|nr:protein mono-ADP-ribosyltransferase PARP12-like isoform X2 [Parambassis ranga]